MLSQTPNFVNGFSLTAETRVVPIALLKLIVKLKACPYPGIITGEKLNVFSVFAIDGGVGATTRSHKLFGFGIVGDPLETSTGQNFHGFSWTVGIPFLELSIPHPT